MSVMSRCAGLLPVALLSLLPGCATLAGEAPPALLDSAPAEVAPVATGSTADAPAASIDRAAAPEAPATTPATHASAAFPLPTGGQRYRLSWDGQMEGSATRLLSCGSDNNCSYQTEGSVPGLATLQETSRFAWQGGRVRFQRYERSLQFLFFPQQLVIERQDDGSIHSVRKGIERSYPGRDDLVDLMGLELQLRADLQAGREPQASYGIADVKGITEVSLTRLADETLTLAGASHPTRVYERRDGDRLTTLWLDPRQAWLPLQIVHHDGNETYRMVWLGADQRR